MSDENLGDVWGASGSDKTSRRDITDWMLICHQRVGSLQMMPFVYQQFAIRDSMNFVAGAYKAVCDLDAWYFEERPANTKRLQRNAELCVSKITVQQHLEMIKQGYKFGDVEHDPE